MVYEDISLKHTKALKHSGQTPTTGCRLLTRLMLGGFILLVCLYLSRGLILPLVSGWLDIGGRPEKTDYVMVLNGDAETRPFVAAALVRRGYSEHALIAAVPQPETARQAGWPSQNELVKAVLVHEGIEEADIRFLNQARNTFEEAGALLSFLDQHPNATVTVVTNNYHSRRTRFVFHQVFGSRKSQLRFVSAPTNGFSKSNWWLFEDGIVRYITEYCKLAFYYVRYGNAYLWAAVVTMLLVVLAGIRRRLVRPEMMHANVA